MPDTRRLAYSENTLSYDLFADKDDAKMIVDNDDDGLLIQSDIITAANGSSYIEYRGSKFTIVVVIRS